MKIGVLTYHGVPNFGAQLQVTSTVGFIRRMGHEAVVLNWYPADLEAMYAKRIPSEQVTIHNEFTNKKLPVTQLCRTEDELVEAVEKNSVDAIIVGSDALFKYVPEKLRRKFNKHRLRFVTRQPLSVERFEGNPFFGGFIARLRKAIPVVAFSVSSQNCPYFAMNKDELGRMKRGMSEFLHISVRDEWTKKMVEHIMGVTGVPVTPDPVFSFNQNNYLPLPTKSEVLAKYHLKEPYVLFCFSTWYAKDAYIQSLAAEAWRRGYQPVAFPMPEKLYDAGIETKVELPLSPLDWYALINYSAGYIGERMHPIVVCLHNAVPFFCFDEYGTTKSIWWGLSKRYMQNSSKTWQIVDKAGLLDNLYGYRTGLSLPMPQTVLDALVAFDRERCRTFAASYQQMYEDSMNDNMNLILSQTK